MHFFHLEGVIFFIILHILPQHTLTKSRTVDKAVQLVVLTYF